MKKLAEITDLECIKCTNKISTDKLSEIQRKANQTLFKYNKRYINQTIKDKLLKTFKDYGQEITSMDVTPKAEAKKQEIVEQLRKIWSSINKYKPDIDKYSYCGSQTLKYSVSTYLHLKEKGKIDPTTAFALLQNMKECREEWKNCTPPPSMNNAVKELLEVITEEYNIR